MRIRYVNTYNASQNDRKHEQSHTKINAADLNISDLHRGRKRSEMDITASKSYISYFLSNYSIIDDIGAVDP